jgi:hypothetical protein
LVTSGPDIDSTPLSCSHVTPEGMVLHAHGRGEPTPNRKQQFEAGHSVVAASTGVELAEQRHPLTVTLHCQ